ncbi:branched-chain amino acid ABC transporter permease [Bradyrhizobium sp. U87765 SZCCT0131]|uniref:branched-chain amino acid ABC transporter permease n=1 Tax=unclassified Bradyrhizobium TaxID=2631580 RepID=UPI001BAB8B31|nr:MULTISPECIES: branched-chain amino acid ABC transporter permease [unclassified Bradyrhizobium]MBR1218563.1 branched-chain amino acid ABC transporter permease [Bradyrhizobium sp. U87765 SZCCT0131]MBR1260491.1 branched-chain amino acid ABC transporter permease [Bradyrhizobium sp. U87765 SZCCT0134]MBR1304061.1 branched-chain amino acid ABC transporter permease [Bradyrhizobium sp. U87765 SZCCT0110]MBR1319667.1 branched-chain amino acid ABC transporter permease [Bradyrhizobium sp. U87765 SZCCT010
MTMWAFIQQTVDGIESGAIYATLALALVFIHRSTGLVNFAQGELAMVSTYATLSLSQAGLSIYAAAMIAMVLSFLAGMVLERVLFRPLSPQEPLPLVVVMLGLFVGLNALAGLIWSYQTQRLPGLFPADLIRIERVTLSVSAIGTLATLLTVCILLYLLFSHTRLGLMLRAAASNVHSAQLLGIPVGLMFGIGWGVAAALGCLAGVLVTPRLFLDPNVMQGILIFAIAAATAGGLDSAPGAVIAGLAIGVIENWAGAYWVGSDLRVVVPLVLILVVLTLRPAGLFGRARAVRV